MKIKIRTPAYSLVAADMSAAEVRTAANAAKDQDMINAYKSVTYEENFKDSVELYSYEMLNTPEGYTSLHMMTTSTILIDDDNNQVSIKDIEDEGEKNKLILVDNLPHKFTVKKPGQDLYSFIASKVYKNKYEDNLEFYPAGTKIIYEGKEVICKNKEFTNKAGKVRRQDSKSVLIGLIYGRGVASIAEQINEKRKPEDKITKEDAQALVDSIYESFPRLKQWMEETHDFIHKHGYIDDAFGRRRRLPEATLPKYSIAQKQNDGDFNPLLGCGNRVDTEKIEKYKKLLEKVTWQKDYERIKKEALAEGIEIHNNNGFIAQAERQSVNFQAQGASSEINKLSMIAIDKNERLKELGFQLLLTIHDEVIGQCPSENAEEVAKIIPEIMVEASKPNVICPMVSESSIFRHWYEDENCTVLNDEFVKLVKDKGLSESEALDKIYENHLEFTYDQLYNYLINHCGYLWDNKNL